MCVCGGGVYVCVGVCGGVGVWEGCGWVGRVDGGGSYDMCVVKWCVYLCFAWAGGDVCVVGWHIMCTVYKQQQRKTSCEFKFPAKERKLKSNFCVHRRRTDWNKESLLMVLFLGVALYIVLIGLYIA